MVPPTPGAEGVGRLCTWEPVTVRPILRELEGECGRMPWQRPLPGTLTALSARVPSPRQLPADPGVGASQPGSRVQCLSPSEKRWLRSQEQCCLSPKDLGCCCFAKEGERRPSAFCFLPLRASAPIFLRLLSLGLSWLRAVGQWAGHGRSCR